MNRAYYTKVFVMEGDRVTTKQLILTPISVDQHDNVTAEYRDPVTGEKQVRLFRPDQVQSAPILLDFA
jgi:hypothetical protein